MKTKNIFLTVALALFSVVAFAQTMAGTSHDFSDQTWTGYVNASNTGRTCIVCHIAHNSDASVMAPLWNRADPGTITQSLYTPYSSATFNAADGSIVGSVGSNAVWTPAAHADYLSDDGSTQGTAQWTPDGSSVLCLSCHDGVGNLDSYGGVSAEGVYSVASGTAGVVRDAAKRNDGTGEHPYSFTYDAALVTADTEGGVAGLKSPDGLTGPVKLEYGKIQCATCHDVHNSYTNEYLLTETTAASALCRTCHTK